MPFTHTPCNAELLEQIGLPASFLGWDIYLNKRAHAALACNNYWSGKDQFTDISLFIHGVEYQIEQRNQFERNGGFSVLYIVKSKHSLDSTYLSKLKKHAKDALKAYLAEKIEKTYSLEIVDTTRPSPPRPLVKLRKVLKLITDLGKDYYLSPAMDLFIPLVISECEAQILETHIRKTNGKTLSRASVLLFELGCEKFRARVLRTDK